MSTPIDTRINKTVWFNKNTGFMCGGERSKEGYIFKTTDGGSNWIRAYTGSYSLYDILFMNDTLGFCCGENMEILRTTNAGNSWKRITKENNYDKFYTGTLYGMFSTGNRVNFFGGRNFNIGFINRAQGDSMLDGFKKFNNELRCGIPIDANSYLACGYGQSYKTIDNSVSFSPYALSDDYFTSSCKINSNIYVFSGFNGGVFLVTGNENSAKQILESKKIIKKEVHFNGIYFVSETQGWVVGNNGVIVETNDGKTFKALDLKTSSNLLSIAPNYNNELIISTEDGQLIKLAY